MSKKKILMLCGTRPAIIKLAPIAIELQSDSELELTIANTEQHKEMSHQAFGIFGLVPDYNLGIMQPNQTLDMLTSRLIERIGELIQELEPDLVMAHGDTQTCFAASLAAFYNGVGVVHVEAGLRSHDIRSPFPEESNRVFVSKIAKYHFAPTQIAVDNLLREGVNPDDVYLVGNSGIDAQRIILERTAVESNTQSTHCRTILVTQHRRENFGKGQDEIFCALRQIAEDYPKTAENGVEIIFAVHPNPKVQKKARKILSGLDNVRLIDPVNYDEMVKLMSQSYLIVTDSGGIQEEAPSLKIPLIVTRYNTERPEAVDAGVAKLVGTDGALLKKSVRTLLDDEAAYAQMQTDQNPFGDGYTAKRIADILKR